MNTIERRLLVLVLSLACTPLAQAQAPESGQANEAQAKVPGQSSVAVNPADQALLEVQSRWALIKYQTAEKQQDAAYQGLLDNLAKLRDQFPTDVRLLVWQGIVLSTQAGARGGLGALSLCKQARSAFEQAISLDAQALDGSAYTSLGSLYYQVPGWPIGFGDDDKAKELLLKGLAVNPQGIDANYFYADFLFDQGDYRGAELALEKVLSAAPRPGREVADEGRRHEAQSLLAKVRHKLS